jgi:hypothetical protein
MNAQMLRQFGDGKYLLIRRHRNHFLPPLGKSIMCVCAVSVGTSMVFVAGGDVK